MGSNIGNKAITGTLWATVDKFGSMVLQFSVNLVLARLLLPSDFGAIGMLTIFMVVSQTIIDGGFSSALIQKKDPTQTDFSTILIWNVGLSLFLYIILFLSAPLIAQFYNIPVLTGVLRIIGINLILNSILIVQQTRLKKQLAFREIAVTNIVMYVFSSGTAIYLAFHGWGVWSLTVQPILFSILSILSLLVMTRWLPSLVFSRQSFKALFSFGGYLFGANILQVICQNLQGLIIGKKFSATQLGYFAQAQKLDQVSSYSIPQVIVQVMYPVYANIKDENERLQATLLMNNRVIAHLIYPLMALLIIIAEPLITLLYGDKWLPSVPYFRILCVGGIFVCLQNLNFYAVAAVGKSKTLFKASLYKWSFLLAALLIGMCFGMYGILWGMVISSINIFITNAWLADRHVHLKLQRQLLALLPTTLVTAATATAIYLLIEIVGISPFWGILLFPALYLGVSALFRLESQKELYEIAKRLVLKKIN